MGGPRPGVAEPGTAYDWAGRYSIAPSTRAPIVREWLDEGELLRDLDEARWGLRPGWAKESGPRSINARLETATTRPVLCSPSAR